MNKNDKKALAILLLIIGFFCYYFFFPNRDWLGKPYLDQTENDGFAVVELFTSEGCSSCPLADELLSKLQTESQGKNIYLLAFHVDYWDSDEWKDAFSDEKYTKRQQQYSQWMNRSLIYTPQFVINGSSEFGGDDGRTLYSLVAKALKNKPINSLQLNVHESIDSLVVDYKTKEIKNSSLLVAIVKKTASSNVKGGENNRAVLNHVQVVQQLTEVTLDKNSGKLIIKKPQNYTEKEWEVIAFVQNNETGSITAAAKPNQK